MDAELFLGEEEKEVEESPPPYQVSRLLQEPSTKQTRSEHSNGMPTTCSAQPAQRAWCLCHVHGIPLLHSCMCPPGLLGLCERGCGPLSVPNSVCLCSYLCVASIQECCLLNSVVLVKPYRLQDMVNTCTCTFGRSLGRGEEVGGPWEEEREWEVLGRRRRSGRSLGGGEGVGGPWEEEREWEVLGRRRGSGRSLGGGEGVGGPWEEEREWEVLERRRGNGRSLGGGEGVGGPWEEEREW